MKKINYLSKIFWSLTLGTTFFITGVNNIFAEENESSEIKDKVVEENNDFEKYNSEEIDMSTTDNPISETIKNGWEFLNGNKYYYENNQLVKKDFRTIENSTYYFNEDGSAHIGWLDLNGKKYYFDINGEMQKNITIEGIELDGEGIARLGWCKDVQGWKYIHDDGTYTKSNFEVIDNQTYYFDANGYMETGWQTIGTKQYYFDETSGIMLKNQWIGDSYLGSDGALISTKRNESQWILNSTGWWYRHEDGSYTTNDFEVINGQTYYFNAAGYMATGWQLVHDTWYYFDGSGAMKTGWFYVGNIWYYLDNEGKMLTGFQDIAGQRYYFNDAGYMLTGWIQDGDGWYYASSSGAISTGWQYINNVWYYLDPDNNGLMLSDVKQSIDNATYFFGQSGQMLTGWINRPEGWYYAETSGAMHTGWLKLSSGKYYLDPNDSTNPGIMVHDEERVIDGKTYKFLSDGRIYTGFVTKDEGTYLINEDGDIVKGWGLYQGYWYYFSPDGTEHPGVMLTNQWLNLNDGTYYLSSDGKMKTGWILDDGSWYYATERGSIVKNGFGTISAKDAGGISRVSYFEVDGKLRMYSFTIGRVNYTVDGSGYITNTTVNGVPYYNQRDPQWAWTVIGSGNMQNTACAVMVATSIVNYYTNLNVNPVDMGKLFYQNGVYNAGGLDGTSADCWEIVKNQYGLNYTSNLSYEDLINNLRMGKIVATSENPGHFTVPGFTHAILLYGIDANGYVNVYDPYDTSKNGKYHISMIWNQQSTAYEDCINGGPFFAF